MNIDEARASRWRFRTYIDHPDAGGPIGSFEADDESGENLTVLIRETDTGRLEVAVHASEQFELVVRPDLPVIIGEGQ